ncbi:MAG: ABC transporter permease [Candidatus Kapabacteria bacterium]|nr:ABC transporter permease [Candidatus Kapabacteria bacterium]
MLAYWIARRYILSRRTLQFISVITMLSLAGISVGVASIICVSAIFNGFHHFYEEMMTATDPHIRIRSANTKHIADTDRIRGLCGGLQGVQSMTGVLSGRIAVSFNGAVTIGEIHGIENVSSPAYSGIASSILIGAFELGDSSALPGIVIGTPMANSLHIGGIGDTVTLTSAAGIGRALQQATTPDGVQCVVRGIYALASNDNSNRVIYSTMPTACTLLETENGVRTSIDIRLADYKNAADAAAILQTRLPESVTVETWYDLHKEIYTTMLFERKMSFVVLSIIVLVAVFNIFALLTMTVVKKKADIAVLQAAGAPVNLIRNIFIIEGTLIGVAGSIIGSALGLGLCFMQQKFEFITLGAQAFLVHALPVHIAWWDVGAIVALSIVLSFAATLYPSHKATTVTITNALRSE